MNSKYEWPTREQWAKNVRTFHSEGYSDIELGVNFKWLPKEREAVIGLMRAEWLCLGHELRANKRVHPEVFQQKHETTQQYIKRVLSVSNEQFEKDGVLRWPLYQRQDLSEAIRRVGQGCPPTGLTCRRLDKQVPGLGEALREPLERYERAWDAKVAGIKAWYLARPIDDEAWEGELERRRDTEERDVVII